MKLYFMSVLLLLSTFNVGSDIIRTIDFKLRRVLDFIDQRYEEIHFDGLFGVTFAQAFLEKTLSFRLDKNIKRGIIELIKKCQEIHNKMFPLLPNYPEYMITFRNKLLDVNKWSTLLTDRFTLNKLEHLGYYRNWTTETVINNKKAIYKGVKSDICLREILEFSQPNRHCHVSPVCQEMMLDEGRIDSGYLLTHRLLYLQVVKLAGCKLPEKSWSIPKYTQHFCSYILKEAVTNDVLGYPYHDIFLEQIVLCGMEGYAEFLNNKWLSKILEWQNSQGCYESMTQNITRRTSFIIDFGCSDHSTGLGAAALALYLRFTVWPNVYIY